MPVFAPSYEQGSYSEFDNNDSKGDNKSDQRSKSPMILSDDDEIKLVTNSIDTTLSNKKSTKSFDRSIPFEEFKKNVKEIDSLS